MKEPADQLPTTPAYFKELQALPEELREPFNDLVKSYRFHATMHHSHPFVSYKVIASLIKEGWRLSGGAADSSAT